MKKVMKQALALLVCVAMTCALLPAVRTEAAGSAMNIYAMYLESDDKGESVLLESGGEYLLMDLGAYGNVDAVINQLNGLGVKKISLYFSHMHLDHYGGGSKAAGVIGGVQKLESAGIEITKLYAPDPSLAPESVDYADKYDKFKKFMGNRPIEYLTVGSRFSVGDADIDIIGPLHTDRIHPDDYADEKSSDDGGDAIVKYTYYENNCSLVAKVTCGNTVYLSIGDALEDEVGELVKAYGTSLHADILKLSHHGTGSGSTEEFMKAVTPSFSFAQNTGLAGKSRVTQKWLTNMSRKLSTAYGMCYLVANEQKTLIYEVKNNRIKLYENSIDAAHMLTGWVRLAGGDGEFRSIDRYYFDAEGRPLTGVQKIDGKYFYFGKGGCMEYGNFAENGTYQGWKSGADGKRYFTFSSDKEYAYMAYGFQKIGRDTYYFDKNGCKADGKTRTVLKKIGKYKYAIGKSGAVVKNGWSTIGRDKYYFDKNGRMVTNIIVKIAKESYYFGKDGKMVRAKANKRKVITVNGRKYIVGISGALTRA